MNVCSLAQAASSASNSINPQDKALINFLLIAAVLGVGLLVVFGLLIAWRNLILRQREIEFEHEQREEDLPHPDAWSTAGQRMDPPLAQPDEAHISPSTDPIPGEDYNPLDQDPEDDDDDDFPFDRDDDDDDDEGPFDKA